MKERGNIFSTSSEEKYTMKKLLLALFALTLLVAFTAPSYAADFKYSGWFRVRGIGQDNLDGNDEDDDNRNNMDWLYRPKFTAKSKNVTAMLEFNLGGDFEDGPDGAGKRPAVSVNRWFADHAIPGSAVRMRWGRWDFAGPDGEIFDNNGWHREQGIALYGKLSKNVSLSMFHTKEIDDKGPDNEDKADYFASLSIKASPALTLTPWAANSRDGADDSYNYSYLGLHAKGKMGVIGLNASGVFQSGDLTDTEEISAWAILVRTTSSFGRMKLTGHLTMLSGDDNAADNETNTFKFPSGAGSIHGGLFMSSRSLAGYGAHYGRNLSHLNGAVVVGVSVDYKVSKTLMFRGAVYSHNAAESSTAAGADDAKDFGTELNAGLKWQIYPSLYLAMDAGIMMRGDYGKTASQEIDDAWMAAWRLNHSF